MLELAEAKRLISEAGFRPYVRKVKGRAYITLKRGSREVGVGPFSQDVWDSLQSEWTLSVYGSKPSGTASQAQAPKLSVSDVSMIFDFLSKGYDAAQIVQRLCLDPDDVEYAAKRYMELKGLKVDWIESIHETLKLATEASEAFKRFADNVMACSMLRQRICSHFDKDKGECTLDWDPSIVELVKDLKLESAQPFTVVEKSESLWGSRMKIKPSPLWCSMACPNFKME